MKNNYNEKILFIDTETGGQIPGKHSLLSAALVVWDINNGIVDSIEFFLHSNDYVYTEEAIKINKFNIEEHKLKAIPAIEFIKSIDLFCAKHFPEGYLIPLGGHNIQFDVNFLKVLYSSQNRSFNSRFSHRTLDTYSIGKYLFDCRLLDIDSLSSSKLFSNFKIDIKNRHSAIDDAKATAMLYERMISLIKKQD